MEESPTDPISSQNEKPNASAKRKNEENGQPRSKRNRYISIACNECKRRKIKCNGQTPCQRCGNLSLECLYTPNCCNNLKDSEDFKRMDAHITALQEQVDILFANLSDLRTHVDTNVATPFNGQHYNGPISLSQSTPSTAISRSQSTAGHSHPRFQGPMSSAFGFGVAKSSLQTMGITGAEDGTDEGVMTQDATPTNSPSAPTRILPKRFVHTNKDPIWMISREEAFRLCHVWQDEMGLMYPILDFEKTIRHATLVFTFVETAARSGLVQTGLPGADAIVDDQTCLLKLMIAIALVLEGNGKSDLGKKMFENVYNAVETYLFGSADIKTIQMLTLAAMYHFHGDNETLAWRIIGLAARMCMELGLHRKETYQTLFDKDVDRSCVINLFWSIYVVDRRWSFGTGLPFLMQDEDIDPLLPRPDDSTPYLASMVAYSAIGSKVWRSVANADTGAIAINKDDIGYLDYQVLQWQRSIPDSLRYIHPNSGQRQEPCSRGLHRLRILLYLRANQMRLHIYRPILHTTTSIADNLSYARVAVDVAKDTIRVLTHTKQTTDLYHTQQVMFNYFLISALAVLLLGVSHAPLQFSSHCRDEFYMALDLVRGFSVNSHISKRLWKTIKVLKEIGPKLGLNMRHSEADAADAHSTAAVAMAGLAGHQVDELAVFSNARNSNNPIEESPNGMANDLISLFEAAGGLSNLPNEYGLSAPETVPHTEALTSAFGHENELSKILKELF